MTRANQPVVVGTTGASGSALGLRLIGHLLQLNVPVEWIATPACLQVCVSETGFKPGPRGHRAEALVAFLGLPAEKTALLSCYGDEEIGQKPASGTHLTQGMVILPCSMGSLAKIATGLSDTLLSRAADVTLKESRPLILVPRETPFNAIHLENMLKLSRLGVRMIPPMLAFYQPEFTQGQSATALLEAQMDYTLGKVLDHLGLPHTLSPRWQGLI